MTKFNNVEVVQFSDRRYNYQRSSLKILGCTKSNSIKGCIGKLSNFPAIELDFVEAAFAVLKHDVLLLGISAVTFEACVSGFKRQLTLQSKDNGSNLRSYDQIKFASPSAFPPMLDTTPINSMASIDRLAAFVEPPDTLI